MLFSSSIPMNLGFNLLKKLKCLLVFKIYILDKYSLLIYYLNKTFGIHLN